jgi:aspartate/methionine/tyrosine aminotransferase
MDSGLTSRWAQAVAELKNEGAYAVLAKATALEQQGKDVVHFEIGQPDYPTPQHIVEAGVAAMTGGKTTYANEICGSHSRGMMGHASTTIVHLGWLIVID